MKRCFPLVAFSKRAPFIRDIKAEPHQQSDLVRIDTLWRPPLLLVVSRGDPPPSGGGFTKIGRPDSARSCRAGPAHFGGLLGPPLVRRRPRAGHLYLRRGPDLTTIVAIDVRVAESFENSVAMMPDYDSSSLRPM